MYVIGVNEWDFLNIKSRTMMTWESCRTWNEVEKVMYECNLSEATIFPNYELATKIVEEIKIRKEEIQFENNSIIGKILDEKEEKTLDIDNLKVFELIPTECKDNQ